MRQAEGLTSRHAPVRKERGVRYCNNETVSDMGLERPQKPAERACCAGYLESWEGRYASQRASGGASGAWIGQDRERKGLCPVDESRPAIRFQHMGRQMGKGVPAEFPEAKNSDFRWASPFFPVTQFLEVPCNSITSLQHGYQDMNAVIVGLDAIGTVFGRTRWTIRRWIDQESFPASQLPDGTWTTTQSLIEQWLRDRWLSSRRRVK